MIRDDAAAWPADQAADVYSQCGEDGLISAILDRLPSTDSWCVEFGAWDGVHLSNSRNLIESRGYRAVLIEADPEKCRGLGRTYAEFPGVHAVEAFVGFTEADGLDAILAPYDVPTDFDFLSIDIDGNDYHAWAAVFRYQPKLVCVEFNPTIPTEVDFVQPADGAARQGASLAALVRLGAEKGYELVAATLVNALFVRADLFPALGIGDNSPHRLRRDTSLVTHVFTGYDGSVHVVGNEWLPWHALPMKMRRQALPRVLRMFPGDYGRGRRLLMAGYQVVRYPRLTLRRVRKHGLPR
jgi:hypothetical protein